MRETRSNSVEEGQKSVHREDGGRVPRLFRREAVEHQAVRLDGAISLAVPLGWHIIGYFLFAMVTVALVFLCFATYSKSIEVTGVIAPAAGVVTILPQRAGVVSNVMVVEGQSVARGTPLAVVATGQYASDGSDYSSRMNEAIERREESLSRQSAQTSDAQTAEMNGQLANIDGLTKEIANLQTRLSLERAMIKNAEQQMTSVAELAEKGFISKRDFLQREDVLLSRRKELLQIEQEIVVKRSAVEEAMRRIEQIRAQGSAQRASLESSRNEIVQQRLALASQQGFSMIAPLDGVVTAITARAGQQAHPDTALMSIVPAKSVMTAELYVPTSGIAWLEVGQTVRVAVDAFPYERFGTVTTVIADVSKVTVQKPGGAEGTSAMYLVRANFEQPWIMAFGKRQPFLPGMTLKGRVTLKRQSLIEWLFEPLFATMSSARA